MFTAEFDTLAVDEDPTKCVQIPIVNDNVTEPVETFTVIFTVNGRETSNSTVTIIDNDGGEQ